MKTILISPYISAGSIHRFMVPANVSRCVHKQGMLPVVMSYDDTVCVDKIETYRHCITMYLANNSVAGIVLSGGAHISSLLPTTALESVCDHISSRDLFEYLLLEESVRYKIPVLGICRGMQMMNVYCGGSLRELIGEDAVLLHREARESTKVSDHLEDHVLEEKHHLHITLQSRLFSHLSTQEMYQVNSVHSQILDRIGTGIVVEATADNEEVEIISHQEYPWLGVQFHPEITPHAGIYAEIWKQWFTMVS